MSTLKSIASDAMPQKLYGGYLGTVLPGVDPKELERVRVRIDDIHLGLKDDEVPWAIVVQPPWQGLTAVGDDDDDVGLFSVPSVGSTVLVNFQGGDPHFPMVVGCVKTTPTKKTAAATNYPNRWGWKDRNANQFYVDTQTGDVNFVHSSGLIITIDPDGELDITAQDNSTLHVNGGTLRITATQDITIDSDANVYINP